MSEILTWIFGGSAIAALSSIVTLGAVRKEAQGKAEQAHADADAVKLTNTERATRILVENIVEPLRQELYDTRKDLGKTNRELVRLRKAIESIQRCPYRAECPVLDELRDEKGAAVVGSREPDSGRHGQDAPPRNRHKRARGGDDEAGDGAALDGDAGDSGGQPR